MQMTYTNPFSTSNALNLLGKDILSYSHIKMETNILRPQLELLG